MYCLNNMYSGLLTPVCGCDSIIESLQLICNKDCYIFTRNAIVTVDSGKNVDSY